MMRTLYSNFILKTRKRLHQQSYSLSSSKWHFLVTDTVYNSYCAHRYVPSVNKTTGRIMRNVTTAKYQQCYNPFDNFEYQDCKGKNSSDKTILICGDGDLSFGASLAMEYKNKVIYSDTNSSNVELIVSVLESEIDHNRVYQKSNQNIDIIKECGHKVIFEIDATKLQQHFCQNEQHFDRIQFNFPHWKGKQNNRRNRQLIHDFFISASDFLPPGGQIHMGLLDHQGGMNTSKRNEWKRSWMAGLYAAESNLLLTHVLPYEWRDRPFMLRNKAHMFIFTKPDNLITASEDVQLCSYFSLFVSLPSSKNVFGGVNIDGWSKEEIIDSTFMQDSMKSLINHLGLDVKVDLWRMHFDTNSAGGNNQYLSAEYKVCLLGEYMPITFNNATLCKSLIEKEVLDKTTDTRLGTWSVSKVMPYSLVN